MTTQARPSWDDEMDRQIKATESAMALAKDNEQVIIAQRAEIDRLLAIVGAETPIAALSLADTWHAEKNLYMQQVSELQDQNAMLRSLLRVIELVNEIETSTT